MRKVPALIISMGERGVLLTRIHGPRTARLQALCAGSHVKKRDLIRGTVRHFIGSFTLGV